MYLSEDQKRPVLAIDLGASHTKLAWRPGWTKDTDQQLQLADHFFNKPSVCIAIDGESHIPSIALQSGKSLEWKYGTQAAELTPHPGTTLRLNWKSVLFAPNPSQQDLSDANMVAKGFFEWLHAKLKKLALKDFDKCSIALCIPALKEQKLGAERITETLRQTSWRSHPIWNTLEPRANIVGLASATALNSIEGQVRFEARNHITFARHTNFSVNLREIYGAASPLITWAQQAGQAGTTPKKVGIIDIGAFTTDFAVCKVLHTGDLKVSDDGQRSIRHGVSYLDGQLRDFLRGKGLDTQQITHLGFNLAKKQIYRRQEYMMTDGKKAVLVKPEISRVWISNFTEIILNQIDKLTKEWMAFVLTGGGAAIPLVSEYLERALLSKGLINLQNRFDDIDTRVATALGAASVESQNWNQIKVEQPTQAPIPLVLPVVRTGRDCTCGGNKDCQKCGGDGWIEEPIGVPQIIATPARRVTPQPTNPALSLPASTEATARRSVNRRAQAPSEEKSVLAIDSKTILELGAILEVWNEPKALDQFTLQGWMGKLVFGQSIKQDRQRKILSEMKTVEGKGAWLRMLCLATCFSVRAKPLVIKKFWTERLHDVWPILIPTSLKEPFQTSYTKKLDQVFVTAIHRQFNEQSASGEDAELWRRVFYDFRKLHHFVYRNEFVDCVFDLVASPRSTAHTMIHFMKSGKMPGDHGRWAGVLGQSMTSPLFFLLRELRRLEILDSRFDKGCFYINSPVRRLATRLDWISAAPNTSYGIDHLEGFAEICQTRMVRECPDLGSFFDLPFQWYAHQNPR